MITAVAVAPSTCVRSSSTWGGPKARRRTYYVKLELDIAAPKSLPLQAPHVSVVYCLQLPSEQARLRLLMELLGALPPTSVQAALAQRNDGHNVTVEESEFEDLARDDHKRAAADKCYGEFLGPSRCDVDGEFLDPGRCDADGCEIVGIGVPV